MLVRVAETDSVAGRIAAEVADLERVAFSADRAVSRLHGATRWGGSVTHQGRRVRSFGHITTLVVSARSHRSYSQYGVHRSAEYS
jgi:hypothetical protein